MCMLLCVGLYKLCLCVIRLFILLLCHGSMATLLVPQIPVRSYYIYFMCCVHVCGE